MNNKNTLQDIFDDDDFGLLNIKPASSPTRNGHERLIASFQEINDFFEKYKRVPSKSDNMHERGLFSALKGILESAEKVEILRGYDPFNLLNKIDNKANNKAVNSIEDILSDDVLGLLSGEAESIFDLTHLPKATTMPDYIASRKPCKDFFNFEELFKTCQNDLESGKRQLTPFRTEQIEKGYFFVLKGVLLYVAEKGKREKVNGVFNARLRCIFENETESDMLLRSLSAELYKDGRRVTAHEDNYLNNLNNITDEDKEAGFIYILTSKSTKPAIKSIENLYKIGYSKGAIEERIKNAEKEPTYLMAAVSIVTAFKCYNMNPQKLEQLLHNFFGKSCLAIDVFDEKGKRHTPREWFIAPLEVIEQAIELIITGDIVHFRYDSTKEEIVNR